MAEIDVTTTVSIKDERGRLIVSLSETERKSVTDNPRFWMTFTRGAIQGTEHAIATMLKARYGDHKDG